VITIPLHEAVEVNFYDERSPATMSLMVYAVGKDSIEIQLDDGGPFQDALRKLAGEYLSEALDLNFSMKNGDQTR
jgi:hypothetical protein